MKPLATAALSLFVASCAPAQMRLPAGLADGGTRIVIEGVNGPTKGAFVAGPYSGSFDNSMSRSPLLLGDRKRQAWTSFTIRGGALTEPVTANCEVTSRSIDLGSTEITTAPVTYGCLFERGGQRLNARFELREVMGREASAFREERAGEIGFDGREVRFHSIHSIEGTGMTTITPAGYVFEIGERAVGALDLSGEPTLTMRADLDPASLRSIAVAALALAILREPPAD